MIKPTRSVALGALAGTTAIIIATIAVAATPKSTEAGGEIARNAQRMLDEGRETFRHDTFGDEAFWSDALHLDKAIAGAANGGVGAGVSPKTALSVGLKVDAQALPKDLVAKIKAGKVNLEDPATTLALLKLNAVVGVKGTFDKDGHVKAMGITCAICHSTVDDSFSAGIGKRLDGWPNRDLNVGAIISLAPDLSSVTKLLGVDLATLKKVLGGWGPGKFDAVVFMDGKAVRPDGQTGAVLLPAAYGLAGVNMHTYTGWGSVTYWNAFVANLEMHGRGTFVDPRLKNATQFPVAAKSGFGDVRSADDQITSKLAALQFYQLAIPAPTPPKGSFNAAAATKGQALFVGQAKCATCHVPPLFTEPGYNMHAPAEIGIDDFQASRSPEKKYRTTPLRGLFSRLKGGLYHDGRFPSLGSVVDHYNDKLGLKLTDAQKSDLVEYLKSI